MNGSRSLTSPKYSERETATHVYFWGGPLSQWFSASFAARLTPGGPTLRFRSAEHYMMASKALLFGDEGSLAAILAATQPKTMQDLGRTVKGFDQAKWDAARIPIVVRGNVAKFEQNPDLLEHLASKRGKTLVEGSPKDRTWGVGLAWNDPRIENQANWKGPNLLGQCLMRADQLIVQREAARMAERLQSQSKSSEYEYAR